MGAINTLTGVIDVNREMFSEIIVRNNFSYIEYILDAGQSCDICTEDAKVRQIHCTL
jgi:hypothetical protein